MALRARTRGGAVNTLDRLFFVLTFVALVVLTGIVVIRGRALDRADAALIAHQERIAAQRVWQDSMKAEAARLQAERDSATAREIRAKQEADSLRKARIQIITKNDTIEVPEDVRIHTEWRDEVIGLLTREVNMLDTALEDARAGRDAAVREAALHAERADSLQVIIDEWPVPRQRSDWGFSVGGGGTATSKGMRYGAQVHFGYRVDPVKLIRRLF